MYGDKTLYSIIAPPEATVADVQKMTVEVYLNEEHPPEYILAEPLGKDPKGNSVWGVTVVDGPEASQEAAGADDEMHPGSDLTFGEGGS